MKSNNNKGQEMTFTAVIETTAIGNSYPKSGTTEVVFSSRQNAIDYLCPFYKYRSVHRTHKCKIVRSDGVVLLAPGFGESHYGS